MSCWEIPNLAFFAGSQVGWSGMVGPMYKLISATIQGLTYEVQQYDGEERSWLVTSVPKLSSLPVLKVNSTWQSCTGS